MIQVDRLLAGRPQLKRLYKCATMVFDDYTRLLPYRLQYTWSRLTMPTSATILCYPQRPASFHNIYRIATANRYRITNRPKEADICLYFEDTTYRTPDAFLTSLHQKRRVINYHSRNISKEFVDRVHVQVFGYGLSIDPQTYRAPYVKKSNTNSLHNYHIQNKPEAADPAYSYQRIVQNQVGSDVIDIRLPIIGKVLPTTFVKYRPVASRFSDISSRVEIVETATLLSQAECEQIEKFCKLLGLEFGELDVLRDRQDGKIYIVDANNTPGGPPRALTGTDKKKAVRLLSAAFTDAFYPALQGSFSPAMAAAKASGIPLRTAA